MDNSESNETGVVPPTNAGSGAAGSNIEVDDQPKLDQAQQEAQKTEAPTPLQLRAHQSETETTGEPGGMSNRVTDAGGNPQASPEPESFAETLSLRGLISHFIQHVLPTHTIGRLDKNSPGYADELISHFASELKSKLIAVPSR